MKQEPKIEKERMIDELLKYCYNTPLCKKNGRKCVLFRYCNSHAYFEDKAIEHLYELMEKRIEEDRRMSE